MDHISESLFSTDDINLFWNQWAESNPCWHIKLWTWQKALASIDKMVALSQMIFSDAISWMKSFVFWSKFHWSLFLRVQLTINHTDPDNGLAPNMRQVFIWTNADIVSDCMILHIWIREYLCIRYDTLLFFMIVWRKRIIRTTMNIFCFSNSDLSMMYTLSLLAVVLHKMVSWCDGVMTWNRYPQPMSFPTEIICQRWISGMGR